MKAGDRRFGVPNPLPPSSPDERGHPDVRENSNSPRQLAWESIVGAVTKLFRNQPKARFATEIPLEGRVDQPKALLLTAIGNVFHNGFVQVYDSSIENVIELEGQEVKKRQSPWRRCPPSVMQSASATRMRMHIALTEVTHALAFICRNHLCKSLLWLKTRWWHEPCTCGVTAERSLLSRQHHSKTTHHEPFHCRLC